MRPQTCGKAGADLAARRIGWLVWGVPGALFALGAAWDAARPWLWVPALAVAGSACVLNARRCGRLHCYLTGPLFLLAAAATVLDGLGVVALGRQPILLALVVGTALAYGLECARGKYVGPRSGGQSHASRFP